MFVIALLWFWPTLHHGFRSDDYLTVYYIDRTTGAVSWGRVLEEFVRPWFGGTDLYRPLVSLSFGIEFALCPAGPCHLTNVVLLGITAAATAATAARLAPMRPTAAAIVAGLAVVLHPAAVEPTAWICARTTGMQVAAGAVACWLFASHLDQQRRLWPSVAAVAVALLCKEGAVMLPLSLLAIDLLHHPRRSWSQRLRLHAPFAAVLVLYFAMRLVLMGHLGPSASGSFADRLHYVVVHVGQLFAPPDGKGHRHWSLPLGYHLCWVLPLLAIALLPLWGRFRALSLALPVWCVLLLAPTGLIPSDANTMFGRLVFDAVPALALCLGLAAASTSSRLVIAANAAATAGVLTALALTSSQWLDQYGAEDRVARSVERVLVTAAADATPAKPFAITGLPYLPIFHQKLWGVLGLAPFAPRDLAVIGLPELLVADENAPEFFSDAAPLHAIHAASGTVARFDGGSMTFVPLPRPPSVPSAQLERTSAAPRDFFDVSLWPGTCVAAIEVRLPAPANNVRLRLLEDDVPNTRPFGWHSAPAWSATAWFDTTHAMAPVMLQAFGKPFGGVHVEVDGKDPAAGTVVVVHAMLPARPLLGRFAGRLLTLTRAELSRVPQTPPDGSLRLYLMLPTGVRHMDVPASGADLSAALQEHLRFALDIYAPLTVHWFWQTLPDSPGPPWCSELDWAVVDRDVAR
jgi:hypothetical protein